MKTLIPINRSSIKKNPNAGQRVYYVAGHPSIELTKIYKRGKNWVREEWWGLSIKDCELEGAILSRQEVITSIEKPASWGPELSLTRKQPVETIHTLSPEPRFHYSYKDTPLACDSCQWIFLNSELCSDSRDGYDDWGYSDTVCPRCGEWDCCELEYEKLTDEELEKLCGSSESETGSG